jgi:general nucleoside transport system permease protein
LLSAALYAAAVRLAMPIFLAAMGELFAERGGLVNVGLEGMMLAGAFGAVLGSSLSGSASAGFCAGVVSAIAVASLQALLAVNLGANQVTSGIALNISVLGVTSFLAREIWPAGNVPQVPGIHPVAVPWLSSIPFLGGAVFRQNAVVYLAAGLGVASWWMLSRTGWGLRLRACGEDPRSSDSLGIAVQGLRWQSMLICGALAGLGGAFISLGEVFTFTDAMTGGRGFIALATVIVARWSPGWVFPAALLFGGAEAVAFRAQATSASIPYELLLALPYVLTLIVYAGAVGRAAAPAALGRPYSRG